MACPTRQYSRMGGGWQVWRSVGYCCDDRTSNIFRAGENNQVRAHFVGSFVYIEKGLYSATVQLRRDGSQSTRTSTRPVTQLVGDPNTDLRSVKDLMGHHSASFTIDSYAHGDRERAGPASERVGDQLWGDR